MKDFEAYCCALQDVGFCAVILEDAKSTSSFVLNKIGENCVSRSLCEVVIDAAARLDFPSTFVAHQDVGDVHCRRFGDSCVIFWNPSTSASQPSATTTKPQDLLEYCSTIQPIFAQLPVLILLCRAITDENGKPDVEILAASDYFARYRGFSHGAQLTCARAGRDIGKDPYEELAFYRQAHDSPQKMVKRRFETPFGPTDHLVTPFCIPGHEKEEAYLVAGYDVSEWFEEVKASEARFRNMVENLPVIGLGIEQTVGHSWNQSVVGDWMKTWEEKICIGEPFQLETQLKMVDGIRDYICQMEPVKSSEEGKVDRWFGTCTDITQKKESRRALLAANEQLQKLNNLKSAFISHISHEIRTPLNAITNMLEFLWDSELDKANSNNS